MRQVGPCRAQVQAALIEPPESGHALNRMFRSPGMWIALGLVLFIHGLTCLHARNLSQAARDSDFASTVRAKASSSTVSMGSFIWIIFGLINLFDRFLRQWRDRPRGLFHDLHLGLALAAGG